MKIKEIKKQHRRDFIADFECDHCGHIVKDVQGYDDAFFHGSVVPEMRCPKCKEKAKDTYRPMKTKYPEGYQI